MFTAWILLMLNSLFFTLRLSGGGSGSFPRPLKAEEERMYLERMAQGDLEARNILIEHNLRLVAHIMKKYYTPNGDQDDLISIGTIGLIKGISTFKPDKNVRLATYASRCIENEILMHFRAQRKLQGEVSLSDSIDGDGDGNSLSLMDTISVDDNMLEELDARAWENTLRDLPVRTDSLMVYLKEEYGVTFPLFELGPLAEQFYLVSNRRGKLGAICMCYPGVLESLSQRFEASLYVIPSSIHECMVIPDYDVFPEECLSDMVRDVNEKTVKPQEILSDHVYYYHRESGELTLCEEET